MITVAFAFALPPEDPRFDALADRGWAFRYSGGDFEKDMPGIIVADLRQDEPAGLAALAFIVEASRGALVAVVPEEGKILAAVAAGATHVIAEPFDSDMLESMLLLAARHVDRLALAAGRPGKAALDRFAGIQGASTEVASIEEALRVTPTAVMLLGLKRFDAINAAFGRETGDTLLVAIERRIAAVARVASAGTALVARSEGATFVVVQGGMDAQTVLALAERIVSQVERPFVAGDRFVVLGACIGIVESRDGDSQGDVLRRAQVALAAARDDDVAVRVLSEKDEGTALFDAGLETDLRHALDNGEIDILFQPQVSVISGQIVGVEALARWQHPEHGQLGAELLFSVAARSNYTAALSAHVQHKAASEAAAWPEALDALRLSINVTAADIARPRFAETFLAMIDETGFPRSRLTVEITESGLIADLGAAAALLATLRAGGCRVAIDDFGTGYSSLAYLKALPLDYLKIDKHLSQDIAGTPRDRIVVRGVIDMARSLGLAVVAEGVETEEQLTLLAREGCNYYQGFLCAVPLTVEALTELVTQRSSTAP